ncbi:single-stranded-DNA-specific exonuclease RecJ [Listeria sp. PSOL-1]|uniref:single-stranded-DNA-specific exonuclease RecJ n=1 Tax=Listeria sp. PSOL-1 TaxID=1844999 RepID=UPI0013D263FE|nr:single-stranded-DNA-specific exonuclease RecJ [Listeria sp. PSOL-1]
MIDAKYSWKIDRVDENKTKQVKDALQIDEQLAKILLKRGITTKDQLDKFLHPEKYSGYDPFLFFEMDKAVSRINQAVQNKERILIYGDYDADGVTSIAVLHYALKKLGAAPDYYIPNRFTEGYGPNKAALKKAKDQGYHLIITVDNGIAALDEMKFAKEIALDVIVTDHHEARAVMPEAIAVIHPKHPNSKYPFQELAGVGVSYKLAHALLGEEPTELLDLVAVGTVADLVALTDENRLFVQKGLMKLQQSPNLGLQALAKKAGVKLEGVSEEAIGFALAPRLNAVGRLGPADASCDLLLTVDDNEATFLAEKIDMANKERREIVANITTEATALLENKSEIPRVIVLANPDWNPGVLGIVASRIVEKYSRPTILLAVDEATGLAKGSGRSIQAFHLYQALDKNRALLEAFGGHPMAAGLTVQMVHLQSLIENLNEQAKQLHDEDFRKEQCIEAELELSTVSLPFIKQIEKLAPFGICNPKPIFLFKEIEFANTRRIGADKTHLKTTLAKENSRLDAVGFHVGFLAEKIAINAQVDVIGELSINEWNGSQKAQLQLVDVAVRHWQLFDARNQITWKKLIAEKAIDDRLFVCFLEETYQQLAAEHQPVLQLPTTHQLQKTTINELIIADMPNDLLAIEQIIREIKPKRLYVHFGNSQTEGFDRLPSRAEFATFYKLIKEFQPFTLDKYIPRLSQKFGWKKAQIEFMANVFFELKFAEMDNGAITLTPVQSKRDLTESNYYKKQQQQIETHQKLLYSNYHDLYQWMKQVLET